MNVVIVDGDLSYPPTSGKRLRTLHLMLALAQRHNITYVARSEGALAENRCAAEFLAGHGIEPVLVNAPLPPKSGPGLYLRLAANLLSPLPYSVATHRSEAMRRAVEQVAATRKVDLWQAEWTGYLYALRGQAAPVVVQAHNIDSLIWQRYVEADRRPLHRAYAWAQWRKFVRFERRALRAADHVVAVSSDDAVLAREGFGVEAVDVVDNGVDVAYFREVRPSPESRRVLYLGALDWRPNLDAVGLLLRAIFPAVRARVPGASLTVVGRRPPEWLRDSVAGTPGATLHADVPDVRPHMAASATLAVPLRIGGGSRLKILEALAAGLPVVSSRVGAEGLGLRPGIDYARADSPEEMIEALVGDLTGPQQASARAERAKVGLAERHDWPVLAGRLERAWGRALTSRGGKPLCTSSS